MPFTPPMRRYSVRITVLMVAYILSLMLANWAFPGVRIVHRGRGLRILPPAIVGVFIVIAA